MLETEPSSGVEFLAFKLEMFYKLSPFTSEPVLDPAWSERRLDTIERQKGWRALATLKALCQPK